MHYMVNSHAYWSKKTEMKRTDLHLWGSFWRGCEEKYTKKMVWAEIILILRRQRQGK